MLFFLLCRCKGSGGATSESGNTLQALYDASEHQSSIYAKELSDEDHEIITFFIFHHSRPLTPSSLPSWLFFCVYDT